MENTRLCIYCNSTKQWIWSGKTLKDGSKIYTDSSGSRWAGRRCADCEKQRVQAAIKCDAFIMMIPLLLIGVSHGGGNHRARWIRRVPLIRPPADRVRGNRLK